jgi:hypothetical protein
MELAQDPEAIRKILRRGAEKARSRALPTIKDVRRKVGLLY